jgi:sensor histidine kinase YesM
MIAVAIKTTHFYSQFQLSRNPISLPRSIILQLVGVSGWVACTPLILWLGRRFPIKTGSLLKSLLVHTLTGAFIVIVLQAIGALIFPMLNFPLGAANKTYGQLFPEFILMNFHGNYLVYWMVVGIQNLIAFYNEYRERELLAAKLKGQLTDARLQALKNQLHPHFFFNTLNAISALMYRSPKEAGRMISQLGDLLRVSLKQDESHEIALKEELEFLQSFLQIHQTLMGKRLQIKWNIEPETLDALVPNLILQPLIENAIHHGVAPLEEGGTVTICAARRNGKLLLEVIDDGLGFGAKIISAASRSNHNLGNNGCGGSGIGIANTRARLEHLYSGEHQFSVGELAGSRGTIARILIPFHEKSL